MGADPLGEGSRASAASSSAAATSADDGIFRYKRSFAPHGLVPFFVGRRVLEPELYAELTERAGGASDGAFFPAYRAGTR